MDLLGVLWSELLEAAVLVKQSEFLSQIHMKTEPQTSIGKQNNSWWPQFAALPPPVPASPHSAGTVLPRWKDTQQPVVDY